LADGFKTDILRSEKEILAQKKELEDAKAKYHVFIRNYDKKTREEADRMMQIAATEENKW